jgi:hypothetical protein
LFKRCYEDAIGTAGQKSGQISLADREREPAHVVTVTGQNIESVELDLFILAARIQRSKVGDAIDAKDYGFPIDDELLLPEPASSVSLRWGPSCRVSRLRCNSPYGCP